jgi:hypothetical protein
MHIDHKPPQSHPAPPYVKHEALSGNYRKNNHSTTESHSPSPLYPFIGVSGASKRYAASRSHHQNEHQNAPVDRNVDTNSL